MVSARLQLACVWPLAIDKSARTPPLWQHQLLDMDVALTERQFGLFNDKVRRSMLQMPW
jgi:hypothetical protein